jgi:lipopolysaccharide transport system permease protein
MLIFGVVPDPKILLLPGAAMVAGLAALGIGLWFSAISVRYRDIQQLVPFMLQVLLFLTRSSIRSRSSPLGCRRSTRSIRLWDG